MRRSAALIHARQSLAIQLLQILERPAELAVDVVDNARPRCAWVLIGRNDLVAHGGKRTGFIDGEEPPWGAIAAACDPGSGSRGRRDCSLQERTAVYFEARIHGLLRLKGTGAAVKAL